MAGAVVREICVVGASNMGQQIAEWGRKTGKGFYEYKEKM
jgi:3-hydroxyacyl-CoA dehydrogenase